jgi:hypothetical protein
VFDHPVQEKQLGHTVTETHVFGMICMFYPRPPSQVLKGPFSRSTGQLHSPEKVTVEMYCRNGPFRLAKANSETGYD